MQNVKVSVIIPTYKRSDRLLDSIESVLNQTLDGVEIIVVDDNNPDTEYRKSTAKKMLTFANNPQVIYIQHDVNKNGAAARNTGLFASHSEFIAFLDDDDEFLPNKLETQKKYLENNPEFDAVYTGRYQNNRIVSSKITGDLSEQILLEEFTPMTSTLMFRRQAILDINGFDESFRRHQDYEMLLRFFKKHKIGSIEEPLAKIGVNDGENEPHGENLINIKKQYLNTFSDDIERLDKNRPGFKKAVYIRTYRFMFFDHLSQKLFKEAFDAYFKGVKLSFFKFNISVVKYAFKYIKVHVNRKR